MSVAMLEGKITYTVPSSISWRQAPAARCQAARYLRSLARQDINRRDLGVVCEGLNHRENGYWKAIDIRTTNAAMKSTLQNVDLFYAGGANTDAERAAVISSSVAPLLRDVNIRYSGDAAIRIENPKTPLQIKNCDISENRGIGLIIKNSSADVTIVSSTFSKNFPVGMQVTAGHTSSNLQITDSTFEENSGAGLMLSEVPMNVDIRQSNFSTNSHYGLSVFTETHVSLVTDGCHFDQNGLNGFHARYLGVSGNRSHTVLRNGVAEGNDGNGFNLEIEYQEYQSITYPPISDQIIIDQSYFTSNKNGSVKIFIDNSYEDRFPVVQLSGGVHQDNMATVIEVGGTRSEVTVQDVEFDSSQCGSKSVIHVHGYDKTVNITGNRFVSNVCRRVVLFNTTDLSAGSHPLSVEGNIFENNEYEPESLAHISEPLNEYCTIEIVGSGEEHTITQNSFFNRPTGLELCSSDSYLLAVTQIRAENNWWGTTDTDLIKEKIFDNNDWNSGGLVRFSPYLNSPSGNPIYIVDTGTMTASSLGGLLNGTLRLTAYDSPVTLTRDLTILPDSVLIVEAGVEFRVRERVGILNLGKLQLEGLPSSPITFDVTRKTVSNRTIPVRLTGDTNTGEGRLEVQYSGQWVPVCHDWYGEFATIACRQLGLGSYDSATRHYDYSNRNWLTIRCDGSEDNIGECSLYHTSRCAGSWYNQLRLTCDPTPGWGGIVSLSNQTFEPHDINLFHVGHLHAHKASGLLIHGSSTSSVINNVVMEQFVGTSSGIEFEDLQPSQHITLKNITLEALPLWIVNGARKRVRLRCERTVKAPDGYYIRVTVTKTDFNSPSSRNSLTIQESLASNETTRVEIESSLVQGNDLGGIFTHFGNTQPSLFSAVIVHNSEIISNKRFALHVTVEIGGYKSYYYLSHNMLDNPDMNYAMCSRVFTTSPDGMIDARYNWWGTSVETEIQEKIHDFDDWNDRAAVDYFPYLTGPDLSSPPADPSDQDFTMTADNIGGRLYHSLHLQKDGDPYIIKADLTVLKHSSLRIDPGSTIKIHPCLGLLNLGTLVAQGTHTEPINFELADVPVHQPQVRLVGGRFPWEGRVEVFYNGEWGSVCGRSYWNSQDANVVCRELGYGPSTVYSTYSFGQGSGPIWFGRYNSRPDCYGHEMSIFNCLRGPPGNVYSGCTHYYDVGIRCNMNTHVSPRPTCQMKKWGGITSKSTTTEIFTNLKFSNTGNLHGRSHAAISIKDEQGTTKISHIEISECVGTGIQLLGGKTTQNVKNVNISRSDGYAGISITGRTSRSMSSTNIRITDSIFTAGSFELIAHTRSITNCLGNPESIIRLCAEESDQQLNNDMCFVETGRTGSTCYKHLYAGLGVTVELTLTFVQFQWQCCSSSILRVFADRSQTQQIGEVTRSDNGKTYIRFVSQTMMSLQYRSYYNDDQIFGEVMIYNETGVTGPSKYIIENSMVDNTTGTVINVTPANGAIFDIQRNVFLHNQPHTDDNEQAVIRSVLVDSNISVRNNYMANNFMACLSLDLTNQKGGNITVLNNIFFRNTAGTSLMVTGASSSSTQQPIFIDNNVFSSNDVGSNENVIKFENVDGQLSNNVFVNNSGQHVVTWEGRSKTDSLQRCENNLFYDNIALTPGKKYTLVVSGRDVQLHGNVLINPANDAELATSDRTRYYPVNATLNWWGFNSTSDISSRIIDKNDRWDWAEAHFQPWTQEELIDVCFPGEFGPNCTGTCHCASGDSVCDIRTGVCFSGGCKAGWKGSDCQTACLPGEFGPDCTSTCHCASGDSVCDIWTGVCSSGGCEAGWKGSSCHIVCSPLEFGPNCTGTCQCASKDFMCDIRNGVCSSEGCEAGWNGSNCEFGPNCTGICNCASGDSVCDIRTGVCSSGGCEAGWKGSSCQKVCSVGEFGPNCTFTCHCASGDSVCDIRAGVCSSGGCQAGLKGDSCQTVCLPGEFGPNCTGTCHCASGDSVCDIRTGVCSSGGCEAGWNGSNCQTACLPGEFGPNCTDTCHCASGDSVCDIRTGVCSSGGCEAGWKGSSCQKVCSVGEFGPNCTFTCHCASGDSVCDIRTGVCSSGGCQAGLKGDSCQTVCLPGEFGPNCTGTCHCASGDSVCDIRTGVCSSGGCEAGWHGSNCQTACLLGEFGPNCTFTCHCASRDSVCNIRTGVCSSGGCEAGWNGSNCQTACLSGEFGPNCTGTCHCASGDSVCDIRTGVCSSGGCEAGWKGSSCQKVCSVGEFGPNCTFTCHCASGDSVCDIRTGVCSSRGCEAGWKGDSCQTVCLLGEFGPNCTFTCHCASGDSVCDIRTGVCSSGGCEAGWNGSNCQTACLPGEFGPDCTGTCHCASGDSVCDIRTGVCSSGGCEAGWKGSSCQKVCSVGEFGPNCTFTCHCASGDSVCDIRTGVCSSGGCQAGLKGDSCQTVCLPGEFGPNCTGTCHCASGDSVCDIRTGVCSSRGCEAGWNGSNCQTACLPGEFGPNCTDTCHCASGDSVCDIRTGVCSSGGCEAGWKGSSCQKVCLLGEFGPNCTFTCHCASRDSVCNIRTGVCSSGGCEAGWNGSNCQTACLSGEFGPNCTGTCHCASGDSVCDIRTGVCFSGGCEAGWKGSSCQKVCSVGEFGPNCTFTCHCASGDSVCDIRTGVCSSGGCEAGWNGSNCQTEVASRGVVDRAFGAQHRGPGSIPVRSTGACPNMRTDVVPLERHFTRIPPQFEGQVSNGSCLQLADESSARRAGIVKADLERNQVIRQLAARIPTRTSTSPSIWIRWERRMPKCVVCLPGEFGPNCTGTCHCVSGHFVCDIRTGVCSSGGCEAGWKGSSCQTACSPGKFGFNCTGICNCASGDSVCDIRTGVCSSGGCEAGWKGNCQTGTTCDKTDGRCSGCDDPWVGDTCKMVPSTILDHPDSFTVAIHDKATFSCTGRGVPAPTVVWHHDDQVITPGDQVSVEVTDGGLVGEQHVTNSTLTIASARPHNSGQYVCIMSNPEGVATSEEAALVVQVNPVVSIRPSEVQDLVVGEVISITCKTKIRSSDYTYQWTVDGSVIPNQRGTVFRYKALSGVHKVKCKVTSPSGETESQDSTITVLSKGTVTFVSSMRITGRNFTPEMANPDSDAFQSISAEIKDWYQQALGRIQGNIYIRVKDAKAGSIITNQNVNVQDAELQDQDLFDSISNALQTAVRTPSSLGLDPTSLTFLTTTCYGETVTVTDPSVNRVNLTFPDSAGDTHVYSEEKCANNTESAGVPLAVRRCMGTFQTGVTWARPELLDCGLDLSKLAEVPVTPDNVADVAADLQILTSVGSSLMAENIADASTVLDNLVNTTGDENVGYSVVVSVDQIMNTDDDVLQQSQVNDQSLTRIVRAIEQFNDRVNLTSNNFRRIEKNIGVETYKVHAAELINSVGFAFLDGSDDLEDGLVRSYSDSSSIPTDQVDASIVLPATTFLKGNISDPSAGEVRLSFIIYLNSRLFQSNQTSPSTKTRVNSRVIASRVTGIELKNLSNPVVTRYLPLVQNSTDSTVNNMRCVFWDFEAGGGVGAWSTEGCAFSGIDNGRVVCECNHLTNFAVLMDIYGGLHSFLLDLITKIGIAVSITGLSLTLISYMIFKPLRKTRPQHILTNLCIALLATLIIFLTGIDATHSPIGCTIVAFLLHYFLLAVFMWMAVEAFNMYLAFIKVLGAHVTRFILKAAIFAWGLPLVIAIATLAVDVPSTYPNGQGTYRSTSFCWLQGNQLYYGFLLPAGLVLLFNAIVYIMVISKLTCGGRTDGKVAHPRSGATKQNLRIAIAIMVLVGLTWIFGFFMIRRQERTAGDNSGGWGPGY
ncbi:hypothetical protein Bbelb_352850 [Branchiostoma belcheri]|nr:hypothetical protein Bbelb_352850 [Branchiostoma belcheri]